jgi:K+-sensing histidine kinase KdpD
MTLRTELETFILQTEHAELLEEFERMRPERLASLRVLATALDNQLRELLEGPKTFIDRFPQKLGEQRGHLTQAPDPELWVDSYQRVKAQFTRIDELLTSVRSAVEDPNLCFPERVKVHEVVQRELERLAGDLDARKVLVENSVPEDLPEMSVAGERFHRMLELLLKYKLARLSSSAKITIAARVMKTPHSNREEIELTVADNDLGRQTDGGRTESASRQAQESWRINPMLSSIIAYQNGGQLDAHKETDRGTTFFVRLPVNGTTLWSGNTAEKEGGAEPSHFCSQ